MNNLREAASMVIDLYLTDQDSKNYADLKAEELKSNRIGSRKMAHDEPWADPEERSKDRNGKKRKKHKHIGSRKMAYDDDESK